MSKKYVTFKWKNFKKCLGKSVTSEIIDRAKYTDVTLVCDDKVVIEAHKVILSACSPLLRNILLFNPHQHPLIFLRGINHTEMEAILNIMYLGESKLREENLQDFLAAVNDLQIEKISPRLEQTVAIKVEFDEKEADVNVHDGQIQNSNDKVADLDSAMIQKHINTVDTKNNKDKLQYECNVCDYQVATWRYLKLHHQSKHRGIRYPCQQCSYRATTQGDLKRHTLSVHEGVKYSCKDCDYLATTRGDLKNHARAIHEGVRYPCDKCKYKAPRKSSLVNHKIGVHGGQRFRCPECDFHAGHKSSVYKHQKRKHLNFTSRKRIES